MGEVKGISVNDLAALDYAGDINIPKCSRGAGIWTYTIYVYIVSITVESDLSKARENI